MSMVQTIRLARLLHDRYARQPANAVFLGDTEMDVLERDLAFNQAYIMPADAEPKHIDGLRLFRVHAKSHITVCHSPEAPRVAP